MLHRQIANLLAARKSHMTAEDQKRTRSVPGHRDEGVFEVAGGANVYKYDAQPELPRCRLECCGLGGGATNLAKDGHVGALGYDLFQDFQLRGGKLRACAQRRPSDVPTRPRKTGDE